MKVKQWIPIVLALVLGLAALKLTRDRMARVQAPVLSLGVQHVRL